MTRLAVLGLGNLGRGVAADLARRGHQVSVWNRSPEPLEEVEALGLTIRGDEPRRVDVRVAPRLDDAVGDAEVVVVTTPAYGHATVLERLATVVADRHLVVLMPGNLGSFGARQRFEAAGRRPSVVELAVPPLAARQAGPGGVVVPLVTRRMPTAVAPGGPSGRDPMEVVRALWPSADPVTDVLDAFLLNPTYVIHPPLTVASAGAVEHLLDRGGFDVQAQGTTPATRRLLEGIDEERIRVREAFGYPGPHHRLATSYFADAEPGLFGPAIEGAKAELARWKTAVGLEHRYLLEDVVHGLSGLRRLGRAAGVPTPVADAVSNVAGALLGRDLDRDVEGLPGGSLRELLDAVRPQDAAADSPR